MTLISSQGTRNQAKEPRTKIFKDLENPYQKKQVQPATPDLDLKNQPEENQGWNVPLTLKFDQCSNELTRIGVLTTINEDLHNAGIRAAFTKNDDHNVSINILNMEGHIRPEEGSSLPETFKNIVLNTCQKSFNVDNVSQNGRKVTFFQNDDQVHFLDAPTYEH